MKTLQRIFASPFGLGLFAVLFVITFIIMMVLGYRLQNVFYKPRVCIKVKGEDGWLKGYFINKGNYFYDFVVTEPKEKKGMIVIIGKDKYVEGDFCT